MQQELRIIFAGGGTAGHLYPAINLAKIFEKYYKCEFLFFGTSRGIEVRKVPEFGYKLVLLNLRGFQRRVSIQNFLFPFRLISSLLKSSRVIKAFKPNVVIGTGGYVMGPVLRVAIKKKVPVFIQEQNSYPGVTTRLLAKHANAVFTAYEETKKYLAAETKIIESGNPVVVPEKIQNKSEVFKALGLKENLVTIFVFGGSQGAASINAAIKKMLTKYGVTNGTQILWQSGGLQYEEYHEWLRQSNIKNVVLKPFINDMWAAYSISQYCICRAGAMSISELTIAGLPSILIPLKSAAGNHQYKNAKTMFEKNGAILVEDNEQLAENINDRIKNWLANPAQLEEMKKILLKEARPQAGEQIVSKIKNTLDEKLHSK